MSTAAFAQHPNGAHIGCVRPFPVIHSVDDGLFRADYTDPMSAERDFKALAEDDQHSLFRDVSAINLFPASPVPLVLNREVYEWSQAAAAERAIAASSFLCDLYSHNEPRVYGECPDLKRVIERNPYFVKSLVGTRAAQESTWDIEMAMDWMVYRDHAGHLRPVIIESDTCNIGGFFELAFLKHQLTSRWPSLFDQGRFETTNYLSALFDAFRGHSADGDETVVYVEDYLEGSFGEAALPWVKDIVGRSGVRVIGPRSRSRLERGQGILTIDKRLVTRFFNRYYPCVLDNRHPTYPTAPQYLQEHTHHCLPNFWSSVLDDSAMPLHIANCLGSELFVDKATSAFLPALVRTYLGRTPLVEDTFYRLFVTHDGMADRETIAAVFDDPDHWVVKSRLDGGQGKGVYRGRHLASGSRLKNGHSWESLRARVVDAPDEYVAQSEVIECPLNAPCLGERSFELRNLSYVIDGMVFTIPEMQLRTSPLGEDHTLTGTRSAAQIPLLVPATTPIES